MNRKQVGLFFVGIAVACTLLLPSCGGSTELSEDTIRGDFCKAFGEVTFSGKDTLLGVHVMGDGCISVVGYVSGSQKSEEVITDALIKTKDFLSLLSDRKIPEEIKEISLILGLDGKAENDLLLTAGLNTETLKNTTWDELKTYDEFIEKANIVL